MSTMISPVSTNTQAILLLTAPLIIGRGKQDVPPLTPTEYRRLARSLHEINSQPSDLLGPEGHSILQQCSLSVDPSRLQRLLDRGFLLSQAIDHWEARSIWVISRADPEYPRRLKARVKEDAPPVLYGCGDASILARGGLAVIGSRNVDDELTNYAESTGRLASEADCTLISGGARGIDQAAMRGALERQGAVVGVLADSLGKNVIQRDYRSALRDGYLALVSPYDPAAGFNVGNAMRRNKIVYALADAALVISSDYNKGGTWAGAVEQLDKLRYVPVFVRRRGTPQKGLDALHAKGAFAWPEPTLAEQLLEITRVVRVSHDSGLLPRELELSLEYGKSVDGPAMDASGQLRAPASTDPLYDNPADELFAKVRELLSRIESPQSEQAIASNLGVTQVQVREWLKKLVAEGVLEKQSRPIRYRSAVSTGTLFDIPR